MMVQTLVRPGQPPSSSFSLETGRSIVIIDTALTNYQTLVAGVMPGHDVYLSNVNQCGITQITQILRQQSGIAQLHLLSHGRSGELFLGKSVLSLETLPVYAVQLQSWCSALSRDAEILLYGCEVAQGDRGQQFVQQLSTLTGASIAAASAKVGNSSLGGTWSLDIVIGSISSSLALVPRVIEGYAGIFSSNPTQYNLNSATHSSFPRNLINVDGTLYFTATTEAGASRFSSKRELWKIDPITGSPVRIETGIGADQSYLHSFASVNGTLYFNGVASHVICR